MKRKNLVIGGDGLLGNAVVSRLRVAAQPFVQTSRRRKSPGLYLDLAEDLDSWQMPEGVGIAYLFAAITNLQACEDNPGLAHFVNVNQTMRLAARLMESGATVLFPSTNLVFSGTGSCPSPLDFPNPATVYGKLKAEVERRLLALGGNVHIVRYTKIVQPEYTLFSTWAQKLATGKAIQPFSDYFFSPIPLEYTIWASMKIAEKGKAGVWHISGNESISYADAALLIAEEVGADPSLVQPVEVGITLESAAAPAKLNATDTEMFLGERIPSARQTILGILEKSHV